MDVSSANLIELLTFNTPSLAKPPTTEDPFNILKTLSDPASPISLLACIFKTPLPVSPEPAV